jgi:hypothetical protein
MVIFENISFEHRPALGPKRIAVSCYATIQHFDRACGLLREMRHNFVSGVAESVAVLCRVTLDLCS